MTSPSLIFRDVMDTQLDNRVDGNHTCIFDAIHPLEGYQWQESYKTSLKLTAMWQHILRSSGTANRPLRIERISQTSNFHRHWPRIQCCQTQVIGREMEGVSMTAPFKVVVASKGGCNLDLPPGKRMNHTNFIFPWPSLMPSSTGSSVINQKTIMAWQKLPAGQKQPIFSLSGVVQWQITTVQTTFHSEPNASNKLRTLHRPSRYRYHSVVKGGKTSVHVCLGVIHRRTVGDLHRSPRNPDHPHLEPKEFDRFGRKFNHYTTLAQIVKYTSTSHVCLHSRRLFFGRIYHGRNVKSNQLSMNQLSMIVHAEHLRASPRGYPTRLEKGCRALL